MSRQHLLNIPADLRYDSYACMLQQLLKFLRNRSAYQNLHT